VRRLLLSAAIALGAPEICAQVQGQSFVVNENAKDFVRVYFEPGAIRLSSQQRQQLSAAVAKFNSAPWCRYRAWYVVANPVPADKPSGEALAGLRAEYVASLLRLYGVPDRELCGAWSQTFFGGEDTSGKRAGLVYTEVYCSLTPGC